MSVPTLKESDVALVVEDAAVESTSGDATLVKKVPKRYKAAPNSDPIEIEMPDGVIFSLVLKELDSPDRDTYVDRQAARMGFDKKGRPTGIKPLPGQDQWLVERGLWKDGRRVKPEFVKQLPGSTLSMLAAEVRRLSNIQEGLDEESQVRMFTEAKNA